MKDPKAAAERIIKRSKKAAEFNQKWNWGKQKKPGGYVHECEYLGETGVVVGFTPEGNPEVCAYVAQACQDAPTVATAYLELLAENERLRKGTAP